MVKMVFISFTQPIHKGHDMAQWLKEYRNSEVFNLHGGEVAIDVFANYVSEPYGKDEIKIEVPETAEAIKDYQNLIESGYRFVGVYGEELRMYRESKGTDYSPACLAMWKEYNKYAANKIEKRKKKEEALEKMRILTIQIKSLEEELMLDQRYVLLKQLIADRKELDKVVSDNSK